MKKILLLALLLLPFFALAAEQEDLGGIMFVNDTNYYYSCATELCMEVPKEAVHKTGNTVTFYAEITDLDAEGNYIPSTKIEYTDTGDCIKHSSKYANYLPPETVGRVMLDKLCELTVSE